MVQSWPRPVDYSVVRRCHIVTTECLHSDERYVNEELINDETSVGGLIDLLPPDGTELAAQTGNLPIFPRPMGDRACLARDVGPASPYPRAVDRSPERSRHSPTRAARNVKSTAR